MIGLIVATRREADPLIERLDARKVPDRPFEAFRFDASPSRPEGVIVLSRMGRNRAAEVAEYLLDAWAPTAVVNVGICGALSETFESGQVLRVSAAVDGDAVLAGNEPEPVSCDLADWGDLPSGRLASVTDPVFEGERRRALAEHADVVDMEGWAVADICRRRRTPFHGLKGVTDLADASGKADIQENIDAVSSRLADVLVDGLGEFERPETAETAWSRVHRFAKIEHSLFSLPLLLAGAWLGAGGDWPSIWTVVFIALAGVGARTLGMAMNRIFDRDLDALNPRTADRELPSRRMSLAGAYGVAGGGLALYLAACAGLGHLCLMLSPVPAVPLIAYSLLKRFTNLCHFGIGLCLALAPLGAFVAASGTLAFSPEVLLLALFAFCWISGFDIIYALMDMESDRITGVRSIPASLGGVGAQVVAACVHTVAAGAVAALWWLTGAGLLGGAALAVAIAGFLAAYCPRIPIPTRFFPISAVVGVAASLVPLLGEVQ